MNKKILLFVITPILVLAFVTAGILTFMGQVQRDVTVTQAFAFTGENAMDVPALMGGESVVSDNLDITSFASVVIPLSILTGESPVDTDNIHHTVNYLLSSTGSIGTSNENRIYIRAEDTEVTTLSDLTSISWDVDGTGYIAHVDVLIDTTGDGLADDALVFEYAKEEAPFDNAPYPTGKMNTFGDKGSIDDTSFAWLTTEDAGAVGDPGYTAYTLSDWKLGQISNKNSKGIPVDVSVVAFEIETDNWIMDSESVIKNILINEESIEVSLKPLDSLDFNVETKFDFETPDNTYTIVTTVDVRE